MSDRNAIPTLVAIASNAGQLLSAQHVAAERLLNFDGEKYPTDGCAITLSVVLQEVGIGVADTFQAIELGRLLRDTRGWLVIKIGDQQAGDVGSTCGAIPDHGFDHIYLVLQAMNKDEMVVADNQDTKPHFRFVSGQGGKTPTKFFSSCARLV